MFISSLISNTSWNENTVLVLYGNDLQLNSACGSIDGNDVTGLAALQSAAYGRVIGDAACLGVSLLRTYDLIDFLKVLLNIKNSYLAAQSNGTLGNILFICFNDFRIFNEFLDLSDLGIELTLLVLGLVVLTVLRQVTEASCFLDLLCYFLSLNGFQIEKFFLQSLQALLAHFESAACIRHEMQYSFNNNCNRASRRQ